LYQILFPIKRYVFPTFTSSILTPDSHVQITKSVTNCYEREIVMVDQALIPDQVDSIPIERSTIHLQNTAGLSIQKVPDEFVEDVNFRLGRANGNVYHRRPGKDGAHDGQIMVRLKKKRVIVIDYGIKPADAKSVTSSQSIKILPGAGQEICATPECQKIGIPVLLYDSVPEETASLYLRSGLCFTCQRSLNEKRRTQRKRKTIDVNSTQNASPNIGVKDSHGIGFTHEKACISQSGYQEKPFAMTHKKYKLNNEILTLSHDAIIIDGPVHGTKQYGYDYGIREISVDMKESVKDATIKVKQLIDIISNVTPLFEKGRNMSLNTSDTHNAVAIAAAAAAVQGTSMHNEELASAAKAVAAAIPNSVSNLVDVATASRAEIASAAKAVVAAIPSSVSNLVHMSTPSNASLAYSKQIKNEELSAMLSSRSGMSYLYNDTMKSMKKCIFLLSQLGLGLGLDINSRQFYGKGYDGEEFANLDANTLINTCEVADAIASSVRLNQETSSNLMPLLLAAEAKGVIGSVKKESIKSSNVLLCKESSLEGAVAKEQSEVIMEPDEEKFGVIVEI